MKREKRQGNKYRPCSKKIERLHALQIMYDLRGGKPLKLMEQ
jgi:hypothetical protein